MKNTFWRLLKLASPFKSRMVLAALLGFATIASGIGLMATSAYIIAKAALQPVAEGGEHHPNCFGIFSEDHCISSTLVTFVPGMA